MDPNKNNTSQSTIADQAPSLGDEIVESTISGYKLAPVTVAPSPGAPQNANADAKKPSVTFQDPKIASKYRFKFKLPVLPLAILLIGLVLAGSLMLVLSKRNNQASNQDLPKFVKGGASLDLKDDNNSTIDLSRQVTINGKLQVNNSLVVTSTDEPTNPQLGQIYLNKTNSRLYFYNGKQFVEIGPATTIVGPRGPQGERGLAGLKGDKGDIGPAGPSGVASCPYGNCLSLQASSPGVQEVGNINISGAILAGLFSGNGSALTSVDAATLQGNNSSFFTNGSNISSGTLNDSRLSANVTLQGNTFNGSSQLIQATAGGAYPALNGSLITSLDGGNIASGTISNARLTGSGSLTVTAGSGLINGGSVALGGSVSLDIGAGDGITVNANDVAVDSTVCRTSNNCTAAGAAAGDLTGSYPGPTIASLQGKTLTISGSPSTGGVLQYNGTAFVDGLVTNSNIQSGTFSNITGTGALTAGSIGGSFGNINIGSNTFTGNGSGLTSLNASNVSSGTLSDSRLSANVALLNGTGPQTFTGNNKFTGTALIQSASNVAGALRVQDSTANTIFDVDTATKSVGIGATASATAKVYVNTALTNALQINQINTANNLVALQGNGTTVTTITGTGAATFRNSTDSTSAFQIQNASGSSNLFVADTTNTRMAIGQASANYTLDVNGNINVTTGNAYKINGTDICTSSGCLVASSSGIQNQSAIDQTADFRISGTGQANTSLLTPLLDTATVAALDIGTNNAIAINLNQNTVVATDRSFTANGTALFQSGTNSTTAFQIQNAGGDQLLGVDTQTTPNLIANPSFEIDASGWIGRGVSVGVVSSEHYVGSSSLQVDTSNVDDGVLYNASLTSNTSYTFSFFAKLDSASLSGFSTMNVGWSEDGVTDTADCLTSQSVSTAGWTRYSCTFTTGTTSGSPYVYIKQTNFKTRTFYIDGAQLEPTTAINNLISNSDFETNITGWGIYASSTLSQSSTQAYTGSKSLKMVTTGSGSTVGTTYFYPVAPDTEYTVKLYAKLDAASASAQFTIGRFTNMGQAGTESSCASVAPSYTSWTLYTCTFKTGSSLYGAGSRYITFHQSSNLSTAVTVYVDNVSMYIDSVNSPFTLGKINLNGVITSPTVFQNNANSLTAFQIQDASARSNLFVADTINTRIGIGTSAPAYTLDVVGTTRSSDAVLTPLLDTASAGTLNVGTTNATAINLNQNTTIATNKSFTANGSALFQDATNSTTAFQVQNSGGNSLLSIDTATTPNLITNPSFEVDTTGWAQRTSATLTQITSQSYTGKGSMQVVTGAAANNGVKYAYNMASSTQYTLSFYAKAGGTFTTMQVGRSDNGTTGSETNCLTGQTVSTTAWTRYSCTFTTGTTSSTRYIYIKQSDASAHTFYVDGVQLEAAAAATNFKLGTVGIDGIINSHVMLQNATDSITAFQVQNSAGTSNLLVADTVNGRLAVGQASANYALDVNGNINVTSGNAYKINGTDICTSSGCVVDAASGIKNQTTNQTNANLNIQSTGDSSVTAALKSRASQAADLLQAQNSSGTRLMGIAPDGSLTGNAVATGTTATTSGTGTNTTTVTLTGSAFADGDVIFIDNAGQDYYTRITSGGGTASLIVSPSVSYDAGVTVTKYTVQNIGATTADYTTQSNRFFQGYFLGGVVTGAGSTTLSDSNLSSTTAMNFNSPSYVFQPTVDSGSAFQILNSTGLSQLISIDSVTPLVSIVNGLLQVDGNSVTTTISGDLVVNDLSANQALVVDTANKKINLSFGWEGDLQHYVAGTGVSPSSEPSSIIVNGYIYVIGGSGSTTFNYAKLNSDGTPGSWSTTTSTPIVSYQSGIISRNNYIYILGSNAGANSKNVYYARVNSNGTLSSWSSTTSLPAGNDNFTAVAYDGYVYAAGSSTSVYYSKINANGTLGSWTATSMTTGSRPQLVIAGSKLYEFNGQFFSTTQKADIVPSGGLTNVASGPALTMSPYKTRAAFINGYIYAFNDDASSSKDMEYAKIDANSDISGWAISASYSNDISYGAGFAVNNGYIYANGQVMYTANRTSLSGALDLVSNSTQDLAGSAASGAGASLTAGNTNIIGSLNVTGSTTLSQGLGVAGDLNVGGQAVFQNITNSTNAFQVQNSGGNSLLSIDTATTPNLLTNPSLEANIDGWAARSTATLTQSTAQHYVGTASLSAVTGASTNNGVKYNYVLASSTQYSLSFYAKLSSGTFTTMQAGRTDNGTTGGETNCLTSQTVLTTQWTRYTCTFTTGTTSGTPYIYIKQSDATARTFFIDGVQLEAAAAATNFKLGTVAIDGIINSHVILQNNVDSTTAFQIQNASSEQLFNVGTTNTVNLAINGNLEVDATGWAVKGSSTLARDTSQHYIGDASAKVVTTAASNDGAKYTYSLASSTTYSVSLYVKLDGASAAFTNMKIGWSEDGSIDNDCLLSQTVISTGWTRYVCSFTTGTTSGSPYVFIKQPSATAHTFYVDGLQIEASAIGSNIITNPSFETNTTGWTEYAGATIARTTGQAQSGSASLQIDTTGVDLGREGTSYGLGSMLPNTTYTLSMYAKLDSGSASGSFGLYRYTDASELSCSSSQVPSTSSWTLYQCSFTTGTNPVSNGFVAFTQSSSSASPMTVYIDSATLSITKYNPLTVGQIALNGVIASPAVFQNATDSTTAFQIQNNSGTANLLVADTINTRIAIGQAKASYTLDVAGSIRATTSLLAPLLDTTKSETLFIGTNNASDIVLNKNTSIAANKTLTASGTSLFRSATDSSTAFVIQNSASQSLFQVDTANNRITIGGNNSGELSTWSTNANALALTRQKHSSVVANGYIYVVAGSVSKRIQYAKVNADGTVGAWTNSATYDLPNDRQEAVVATANGYLYVAGGCDGSNAVKTVYYAKINSDGSLDSWKTDSPDLPAVRTSAAGFVANGYLYVIGGADSTPTVQSTVYYAKLNANGTTGAWSTNSGGIGGVSATRALHTAVAANGYVYIIGGVDGATTAQTGIGYGKLNTDGTITGWGNGTSLPAARDRHTTVVANGKIYVIGGEVTYNGTKQSTVYYASLWSGGGNGGWTAATNSLASSAGTIMDHSSVVANGNIYVIGGNNGSTVGTVYYASTQKVTVGGALDLVGFSAGSLDDGGGAGGELTSGNTNIVGFLQVAGAASFTQGVSVGGELNVTGNVALATGLVVSKVADGASAVGFTLNTASTFSTAGSKILSVQNNSTEVFSIDKVGNVVTFGHIKSTQTTAPTIGTPTNCGASPTATVTAGSTDSAGSFTITAGTGGPSTCDTIITFNTAYGAAPKSVVLTPAGLNEAYVGFAIPNITSTTFTIAVGVSSPVDSDVLKYYYLVIE